METPSERQTNYTQDGAGNSVQSHSPLPIVTETGEEAQAVDGDGEFDDGEDSEDDDYQYRHLVDQPAGQAMKINIARVIDLLQDQDHIGIVKSHYDKYNRCAFLCSEAIFNSLVKMYDLYFLVIWPRLKHLLGQFPPPIEVKASTYAARNYIGAWIHDLYVSNREAVKKLSPVVFSRHFFHEEVYYSHEYDDFLAKLNASIRPTNITGTSENTLFIPILDEAPAWHTNNPFHIEHYIVDYDLVCGLIEILNSRKLWNFSTILTDTIGTPTWLFDWHTKDQCCAWFPFEGNYTIQDVIMAAIVGVACTPNMGPKDVDDWQDFENGIVPNQINPKDYKRVTPRRFFGGYEIRTIEQQSAPSVATSPASAPAAKKPKVVESTRGVDQMIQRTLRFQVVDWIYNHSVLLNLYFDGRTSALKMIIESSGYQV